TVICAETMAAPVGSVIVPAMLPNPCPCARFDDKVEKITRLRRARTIFLFILVPFQERVAAANVRPVPKAAVLTDVPKRSVVQRGMKRTSTRIQRRPVGFGTVTHGRGR